MPVVGMPMLVLPAATTTAATPIVVTPTKVTPVPAAETTLEVPIPLKFIPAVSQLEVSTPTLATSEASVPTVDVPMLMSTTIMDHSNVYPYFFISLYFSCV